MTGLPKKCLIDTNVPKMANKAVDPNRIPDNLVGCVQACVDAIDHVIKNGGLVIDSGYEIFCEYRGQLSLSGQPGMGDAFIKWVSDNQWKFPVSDRVTITKTGASYKEFPEHPGLSKFDLSDRKFVAVANAHPDKPPIFQAADSKWWGWKDYLQQVGITVRFLCPDYVKEKYEGKMKP